MAALSASDTVVVVVTGGDPVERAHLPDLPAGTRVVAADSGVEHALALGLHVDLVVGDLDSASPAAVERAVAAGASVERHPAAKDATDLELALDAAREMGATRIHVLGGHGGRLDHLLANVLLLARPEHAGVTTTARMGPARLTVVRGSAELDGPIGDLVTLLPAHGIARGVTTTGLLYPLSAEDLRPGTTRGVSNELVDHTATVTLADGVLVAIQPGQLGTHHQEVLR
ncbi:MAG: thiamine diphosphokinase [Acidimicrobiales bacterium]